MGWGLWEKRRRRVYLGIGVFTWTKWDFWGPQRNTSMPSVFEAKLFEGKRSSGGLSGLVCYLEVGPMGFQTDKS